MSIKSIQDISHAFYINLDKRTDRKEHIEQELQKLGISAKRFPAKYIPKNGAVGCTLSHLTLINKAIQENYDHLLVLEDDIQFLEPELFKSQINTFLQTHQNNWDMILLAGNLPVNPFIRSFESVDSTCIQVFYCQTTTGYIVNKHYFQTLKQNISEGLELLIRYPSSKLLYCIDRYWFKLQAVHKWYLIIPLTITQRPDYSDIENKVVNYNKMLLKTIS